MNMPRALSTWCMILYFLFAGLAAFGVMAGGGLFGVLMGIFALGAALFLFLGR